MDQVTPDLNYGNEGAEAKTGKIDPTLIALLQRGPVFFHAALPKKHRHGILLASMAKSEHCNG
jgi:hypothetical protein